MHTNVYILIQASLCVHTNVYILIQAFISGSKDIIELSAILLKMKFNSEGLRMVVKTVVKTERLNTDRLDKDRQTVSKTDTQ